MSNHTIHSEISNRLSDAMSLDKTLIIERLPDTKTIRLYCGEGMPERLESLEALGDQTGYIIAPFTGSTTPILLLTTYTQEEIEMPMPHDRTPATCERTLSIKTSNTKEREQYGQRFRHFKQALSSAEYEKLVLSRSHTTEGQGVDPTQIFIEATDLYPSAYVTLIHIPNYGIMIGATPELLLRRDGNQWETISLAGTRLYEEGQKEWGKKEQQEQHLVTQYISQVITNEGLTPQCQESESYRIGHIEHLRSRITFETTTPPTDTGHLLAKLHPTPAVCGLPKEKAQHFIIENEGYDRGYYTGFLGHIGERHLHLYVNLRCLHIDAKTGEVTLYAGGGLLDRSDEELEWRETESKMKAMGLLLFMSKKEKKSNCHE